METNLRHPPAIPSQPFLWREPRLQETSQPELPAALVHGVPVPLAEPAPPHNWPRVFPGL